jgi:predicted dehydrogenase
MLGVGMVGAGSMARHHLEAWHNSGDTELVAIYNRTRAKAEQLAKQYEIPSVCSQADEIWSRDDVDIVSVCMPHNLHYPISMAAIEAGKHVFCEKPLAMTYPEARQMWKRAQDSGVKTGIQFGHRALPSLVRLRELVSEGFVGQIQTFEARWCFDLGSDPAFPLVWRFKKAIAGAGALGDLGVYAIDAARWLVGEFRGVSGRMRTYIKSRPIVPDGYSLDQVVQMFKEKALPPAQGVATVDNDDVCVFVATFDNEALGLFRTSRLDDDWGLRINGSQGMLRWEQPGNKLLGKRRGEQALAEIELPKSQPVATMVTQFIANIRNDTDLPPTFYDGMKAQQVLDAVIQSAEQERWIPLPG